LLAGTMPAIQAARGAAGARDLSSAGPALNAAEFRQRGIRFERQRRKNAEIVGMSLEESTAANNFQADDEGSIPFTRSIQIQWLSHRLPSQLTLPLGAKLTLLLEEQ
jgi:hypothetical protein